MSVYVTIMPSLRVFEKWLVFILVITMGYDFNKNTQ